MEEGGNTRENTVAWTHHERGVGRAMIEHLRAARYRFTATVLEDMELPEYKGSTFRGGFGGAFRKICCTMRGEECSDCIVPSVCPYAYVFETRVPEGSERLRNIDDIPRPFVMEPPEDSATLLEAGSRVSFHVVLLGRGIEYLPYFILAFRELGQTGIGRRAGLPGRRARFLLDTVEAVGFGRGGSSEGASVVYEKATGIVRQAQPVTGTDIMNAAAGLNMDGGIRLRFMTPTRLKFEHRYVTRPEFHIVIRGLLRRLSSLVYFHHGVEPDADFKALISDAQRVRLDATTARWVDWTRYSSRQDERMTLGGLVGDALYRGDIAPFAPLLVAGTLTHVGKNVTFGLGRYDIIEAVVD